MPGSQLKKKGVGEVRDGRIAEAVSEFRRICRERLREESGISCELNDVIENKKSGYHFQEWIVVKSGIDDSEKTAEERGVKLTDDQKRIIQQLRKHGPRTPRQLSDNLSLRTEVITQQIEKLLKAGIVKDSGSGRARTFELISAEEE
jgi:DNA-binding transcriptional ArsR family regulator